MKLYETPPLAVGRLTVPADELREAKIGADARAALVRRLDSVDEELLLAEKVLAELVRQLEPVLPVGFGQDDPAAPEQATPPSGPSPLAARLSDLARRAHCVVRQLQTIAAAVDL